MFETSWSQSQAFLNKSVFSLQSPSSLEVINVLIVYHERMLAAFTRSSEECACCAQFAEFNVAEHIVFFQVPLGVLATFLANSSYELEVRVKVCGRETRAVALHIEVDVHINRVILRVNIFSEVVVHGHNLTRQDHRFAIRFAPVVTTTIAFGA